MKIVKQSSFHVNLRQYVINIGYSFADIPRFVLQLWQYLGKLASENKFNLI